MTTNNENTPNYDKFRLVSPVDEAEKIKVMREVYGADAERILNSYGTLAYDFLHETMRNGPGSNPYGFTFANRVLLQKDAIDHIKNSEPKYWAPYILYSSKNRSFNQDDYMPRVNESAQKYRKFRAQETAQMAKELKEQKDNMTTEDKINAIKTRFGDKAETILMAYGALAFDIYDKMYTASPMASETDRQAFETGVMTHAKAAKYAGLGENETSAKIVTMSADAYRASQFNYPVYTQTEQRETVSDTKKALRSDAQQSGKEGKITQWLSQVNLPTEMKDTLVEKYGVDMAYSLVQKSMLAPKDTMTTMGEGFKNSKNAISYFAGLDVEANSEKLTELTGLTVKTESTESKPKRAIVLDDVVITAPSILQKPNVLSASNIEIEPVIPEIKSAAELKYDKLLAKKNKTGKNQPDEASGRRAPEVGVTLRDIASLGIDVTNDLQTVLKGMDKDKANSLIPEGGFPDENAVVSKELAVAVINYGLYVKPAMMKNLGKGR